MNENRSNFIKSISAGVQLVCKDAKLFPSVMIAQGCLESADGASELSAKYHNYFGMKPGSSWQGAVINLPTLEYSNGQPHKVTQPFRVYPSAEACFADHVHLLQNVGVYKHAGLFECTSPEAQALALLKAGYATDPGYAKKLIDIINECNLKQYDV